MSDITTLCDALQELVDRDCTVVDRTIEIRFASHEQAMRVLREAREAYRACGSDSVPDEAQAGLRLTDAEPVAWMDPQSRDVISAERKAFWASRLGEGGAHQAAAYSVPLIEFRPTLDIAAAAVGALRTARTHIPAGYVLVPAKPTEAMLDQGEHVNSEWLNDDAPLGQRRYREPAKAVYIAMIAAAQEPKP